MRVALFVAFILGLVPVCLTGCQIHAEEKEQSQEHNTIVVTSPVAKDVTITQPYVCQIHSRRHIEVRALMEGYLEEISVKEGQSVKKDEVLFRVIPALYKARYDAEKAEAEFARVEFINTKMLNEKKVVSDQEVKLYEAKLAKAEAKAKLALAELGFTEVKAQFDGIIDRLYQMQGSLVGKGDLLTTLSDNDLMWVYFNVPESRYFEYKARQGKSRDNPQQLKLADSHIELRLANGEKFNQTGGDTVTIEGKFNNETGNIAFRADFPNPDHLLRHGQTGTILIHRKVKNALIIPQRATFEVLDKRYVYVVDAEHVLHRRPIEIEHEMDDIYVIKSGLNVNDKIILEGARDVHDREKLENFEFRKPEDVLADQKYHAE